MKQNNDAFFEAAGQIVRSHKPNDKVRDGQLIMTNPSRATREQVLEQLNILLGTQRYFVQDAGDFMRLLGMFAIPVGARQMIVGVFSDQLRDFFTTPAQLADLMNTFYGIPPYAEDRLQEAVLDAIGERALARIIRTSADWEQLESALIPGDGARESWWSSLKDRLSRMFVAAPVYTGIFAGALKAAEERVEKNKVRAVAAPASAPAHDNSGPFAGMRRMAAEAKRKKEEAAEAKPDDKRPK